MWRSKKVRYHIVAVRSGLAGCCSLGCDWGFDKALLMGCGKAFYHWSIIACIKAMNLHWINMRQNTPTDKCVCSTFPADYLCERMAGSRGFFPLPASLSLFSACVCVSTCLPTHTLSLLLSLFLLHPFPISIHLSLGISLPLFFAFHAWVQGEDHKRNTWQTRMWYPSHCHTAPSLSSSSSSSSPLPPPRWPPLQRGACKNGKQGFFSSGRKEEEEEEEEKEEEEEVPPPPTPPPPLAPFIPPLPPQLAFHTPGSAIQTRSCMYMSLWTSNTSLLSLSQQTYRRRGRKRGMGWEVSKGQLKLRRYSGSPSDQRVAGRIPAPPGCMSKCPWARYLTPNCSWCAVGFLHGSLCHQCANVASAVKRFEQYADWKSSIQIQAHCSLWWILLELYQWKIMTQERQEIWKTRIQFMSSWVTTWSAKAEADKTFFFFPLRLFQFKSNRKYQIMRHSLISLLPSDSLKTSQTQKALPWS